MARLVRNRLQVTLPDSFQVHVLEVLQKLGRSPLRLRSSSPVMRASIKRFTHFCRTPLRARPAASLPPSFRIFIGTSIFLHAFYAAARCAHAVYVSCRTTGSAHHPPKHERRARDRTIANATLTMASDNAAVIHSTSVAPLNAGVQCFSSNCVCESTPQRALGMAIKRRFSAVPRFAT